MERYQPVFHKLSPGFVQLRSAILHSAFCILRSLRGGFGVALESHWSRIGVALVEPWGGYGVPISWLSTRFGVALMSH